VQGGMASNALHCTQPGCLAYAGERDEVVGVGICLRMSVLHVGHQFVRLHVGPRCVHLCVGPQCVHLYVGPQRVHLCIDRRGVHPRVSASCRC